MNSTVDVSPPARQRQGKTTRQLAGLSHLTGRDTESMRSGLSDAYANAKERAKARSAAITLAGQDIAPMPSSKDPRRRARADRDFKFFCEAYFPPPVHTGVVAGPPPRHRQDRAGSAPSRDAGGGDAL